MVLFLCAIKFKISEKRATPGWSGGFEGKSISKNKNATCLKRKFRLHEIKIIYQ